MLKAKSSRKSTRQTTNNSDDQKKKLFKKLTRIQLSIPHQKEISNSSEQVQIYL